MASAPRSAAGTPGWVAPKSSKYRVRDPGTGMGAEQSAIEMFDVPAGSAFIVEDKGRVMTLLSDGSKTRNHTARFTDDYLDRVLRGYVQCKVDKGKRTGDISHKLSEVERAVQAKRAKFPDSIPDISKHIIAIRIDFRLPDSDLFPRPPPGPLATDGARDESVPAYR